MEITLPEATTLVSQLQTAHRLSVGFYQRLLPLLNDITTALDLDFWSWQPLHTNRPSQGGKSPAEKWAWDLLPMFASRHDFRNQQGEHASTGDMAVVFKIYLDDNFKPEKRKALGIKGEPDPVTMPIGNALLELDLFWCKEKTSTSFDTLWEEADWPSDENMQWEDVGEHMCARRLTFDLAQLIANPEAIVTAVRAEWAAAPQNK